MPSRSFLALFSEQVKIQSDAPALSWGDQIVSYAELDWMVDSMSSAIAELDLT